MIAGPLLIAAAIAIYVLAPHADAATPRATLVVTPAGADRHGGVHTGDIARDFAGRSPGGDDVRLSDLRGKPAIINFWATWCASCLAEMPDLKSVQDEIGADSIGIVAVNTGERSSTATAFLQTLDAPAFHVVMDPTLNVADAYGVFGLSYSVFVDADGVIRATYAGQLTKELIHQYISATMAKQDAPPAPKRLRLLGNVEARKRALVVRTSGSGAVSFASKSLRCDDNYCASETIDALAATIGVTKVERHLDADPPRVDVTFDRNVLSVDGLTMTLADLLGQLPDPLYQGDLQIERQ